MIAEVVLNVPLRRGFDYRVPPAEVERARTGMRAVVPFGSRTLTGVVVGLKERSELPDHRLKTLLRLPDAEPLIPADLLRFTRWVADYYVCGWGEVLNAALPCGLGVRYRVRYRLAEEADREAGLAALTPEMRRWAAAHAEWSEAQWIRVAGSEAERTWLRDAARDGGPVRAMFEFDHPGRARNEKWLRLRPGVALPEPKGRRASSRKAQALRVLQEEGEIPASRLNAFMPNSGATVRALAAEGLIELFLREAPRPQPVPPLPPRQAFHVLTPQQEPVVARIGQALAEGGYRPFLLEGVTGSGKTEVYLHAVRETLGRGRTALMLVPEIALTAEVLNRFRSRFGADVAILHSAMAEGARFAEWMRAREGRARVVIGARSALFAPLPDLGLLIVDEEHDPSYKQDETPRYHARDAALVRARERGAPVVLGTATPSMESLHNVSQGKLERLHLPNRVENRPLPEVELIDLRREPRQKGSALFSVELVEALRETLKRGRQAILFLNRRGFAQLMRCQACGQTLLCPNCSLSLVLHRSDGRLRCHHCEYAEAVPPACPSCRSEELKAFGLGTQRIEEEASTLFPESRVLRMDSDALRRRGELERMLEGIHERQYDIVIGTQILTKGHDFPHITLVGAVLADVALNLPDFRAAERTFQILTQMAGRAGRGDDPGRVLIQTYKPDHHALVHVQDHHAERFAEQELAIRRAAHAPPYAHLALFWVSSTDPARGQRLAREVARRARATGVEGVTAEGPAEAAIRRLNRRYRWMVMLRSVSVSRLRRAIARTLEEPELKVSEPDRVVVDVDPQNLL
jgi:primosomal protein N' (replication factor Y)